MITIAVVEDNREFKEALLGFLNKKKEFSVIGDYINAEDALKGLLKLPPDIAIVDIRLPGISGVDLIKKLKPLLANTQYLVCTSHSDNDIVFDALKYGASGYLIKDAPGDEIYNAIVELFNGGSPISPFIARKIISSMQTNVNTNTLKLTAREHEILKLMAKGLLYKEIASQLIISLETVKNHIKNIYKKLHVENKVEALKKYGVL